MGNILKLRILICLQFLERKSVRKVKASSKELYLISFLHAVFTHSCHNASSFFEKLKVVPIKSKTGFQNAFRCLGREISIQGEGVLPLVQLSISFLISCFENNDLCILCFSR